MHAGGHLLPGHELELRQTLTATLATASTRSENAHLRLVSVAGTLAPPFTFSGMSPLSPALPCCFFRERRIANKTE